jgi:hypothetical protein
MDPLVRIVVFWLRFRPGTAKCKSEVPSFELVCLVNFHLTTTCVQITDKHFSEKVPEHDCTNMRFSTDCLVYSNLVNVAFSSN